jgi:hypothetical protein
MTLKNLPEMMVHFANIARSPSSVFSPMTPRTNRMEICDYRTTNDLRLNRKEPEENPQIAL